MTEFIFTSIYSSIALLLALVSVFIFALTSHWGHRRETGLVAYVFYPTVIIGALTIFFSGRNLALPIEYQVALSAKPAILVWAARLASVFVVLAAAERIFRRLVDGRRQPGNAKLLMLAFLFYFLTNVLSTAALGGHPSLSHEYFYFVLVGSAALLATQGEGEISIRSVRNAFLILLLLGFVCAAWNPDTVISRDYAGLIPGLNGRYAGLSQNPNSLGAIVIAFLLCVWRLPFSSRALNVIAWTAGLGSLVVGQSKTSWAALVVCVVVCQYYSQPAGSWNRRINFNRPAVPIALLSLAMLLAIAAAGVVMFGNIGARLSTFFETRAGYELLTLTGRDQIWDVAIREWRRDPMFGYGLTVWGDAHRLQIGMPFAFHAHNQFFQSLASAGVVGVVGLVCYLLVLLKFSFKTARKSRGLTISLFALIAIRSIAEVPLALIGLGTEQMIHLLLLLLLGAYMREPTTATVQPSQQPGIARIAT